QPGIPPRISPCGAAQLQRRRQLSPLRNRRKLLRLYQFAIACILYMGAGNQRQFHSISALCPRRFRQLQLHSRFQRYKSTCTKLHQCWRVVGLHLYRSQPSYEPQQSRSQLFPQPESLHAQFLCELWGGLLQFHARPEVHRWLTLDRRSQAFHADTQPVARARLRLPRYWGVDQKWDELTGRAAINWLPELDFT